MIDQLNNMDIHHALGLRRVIRKGANEQQGSKSSENAEHYLLDCRVTAAISYY